MRPRKEVLIGDAWKLDFLAEKHGVTSGALPHPLQEIVEEAILSLSAMHQEIFFMRFGEGLPIRTIASNLGYSSHQIIQVKIARIQKEVREYVERSIAEGDTKGDT
jgi:DNA-directed RNA polymerase specialized sigma24 family protein